MEADKENQGPLNESQTSRSRHTREKS